MKPEGPVMYAARRSVALRCLTFAFALSGLCAMPLATCLAQDAGAAAVNPSADAAEESTVSGWRSTGTIEVWSYAQAGAVRDDALLNPGNVIARIPARVLDLDLRANGRVEHGPFDFVWNARLLEEQRWTNVSGVSQGRSTEGTARLGQAVLRYKFGANTFALGRELLTWGPASFRSPSNPFYFDAGRTNPLASTPGVDLARVTFGAGDFRLTSAWVFSTSQIVPAKDLAQSGLIKLDHQGSNHLWSVMASHQRDGGNFVGGFAQYQPDDAWLVYGEWGTSRQAVSVSAGAGGAPPLFVAQRPGERSVDALLGASYTRENGQTLSLEWLHNTGGLTATGTASWFRQAAHAGTYLTTAPGLAMSSLGLALGQGPRLLGQDYLWMSWQSNTQESKQLWRLSWTQNLADGSAQLGLYGERNVWPRVSVFASLNANRGGRASEFGSLSRGLVIAGVKVFAY